MVDGLKGFAQTWRDVVTHIQTTSTENDWPINAQDIKAGNWRDDTPTSIPGIIVYLTPGKTFDAQNIYSQVGTLDLFIVTAGDEDITKGTGDAVALAWKVVQALDGLGKTIRWGREKVRLDTVYGDFVAAHVQCEVWYKEL